MCCFACAVSWASRLLFTGVPARCVVLRVRCPGPPGSCSPVCPLGVLCCVCGVLGLPAPVHRCARSVCCVAVRGVAAGRSLVHPDGGYRSRQGLGTLRAHTRPSGRRLFVAGRGWVPSGRALVHPDGTHTAQSTAANNSTHQHTMAKQTQHRAHSAGEHHKTLSTGKHRTRGPHIAPKGTTQQAAATNERNNTTRLKTAQRRVARRAATRRTNAFRDSARHSTRHHRRKPDSTPQREQHSRKTQPGTRHNTQHQPTAQHNT